MNIFQCVVFICVLDSECFRKTISKVMACTGLKSFSIVHQGLDGISSLSTCEFLFICLLAFDNRNCENFLTEIRIDIQHLDCTLLGFLGCCMRCMSFLPQELSGTKERTCCLLPADYRAPLVVYLRQISVRLDIFLIEITEQSLRSRTYTETLLKFVQSTVCYPCYFRCKTLYVVFLFLKKRFRNEHRHVYVLYTCLFESTVKFVLDVFPDCITCRFDRHASFYACVTAQLCFFYNVSIPLCEIFFHGSDSFY